MERWRWQVASAAVAALAITSSAMLVPRFSAVRAPERHAMQVEAGSTEFQINDISGYAESYVRPGRALSGAGDGSFVVAWNARSADGGIFARRYSAAGDPLGSEIRLTPNGLFVSNPAVASHEDGSFVVVYDDFDIDGPGVFGRCAFADGTPNGDEFFVNAIMGGTQRRADVAATGAGAFVVVWSDYGQSTSGEVMGQRYDGYCDSIGPEFQINSYTTGVQRLPSVASAGDGTFVVVWESGYSVSGAGADGAGAGVSAQRFAGDGTKVGSEFVVNTTTADDQIEPDVEVEPGGGFVVAWQSNGADADGSSAIVARRFSSSGTATSTEFRVNAYTPNAQDAPALALAGDGSFVVTWQSGDSDGIPNGPDGSKTGIVARHFDAAGQPAGDELQVNVYTTGFQHDVSVRRRDDGGFVVVWAGPSAADVNGLVGRMIGSAVATTTLPPASTTTSIAVGSTLWVTLPDTSSTTVSTTTTFAAPTTTTSAPTTTLPVPTTTLGTPTTTTVPTTTVLAPTTTATAPTTTVATPTTTVATPPTTVVTPTTTTTAIPPTTTLPIIGACGDAVSGAKYVGQLHPGDITASDALRVLQTAVGLANCLACVCDVDYSGAITASDALAVLRVAVGDVNHFVCPPCLP